jgi:hypothetical protein
MSVTFENLSWARWPRGEPPTQGPGVVETASGESTLAQASLALLDEEDDLVLPVVIGIDEMALPAARRLRGAAALNAARCRHQHHRA